MEWHMDKYFEHEGHICLNERDTALIEKCYDKMQDHMDEFFQLFNTVENLVEHDMAMREQKRKYARGVI